MENRVSAKCDFTRLSDSNRETQIPAPHAISYLPFSPSPSPYLVRMFLR